MVSKGPNRVRDKPEDRTDHSDSHSVTAFDEQVDGRFGTGTERGLTPLRAEIDAKSISNRV